MNMDEKFDQDDTVTRKISRLEDLGVLERTDPHGHTAAFASTSTIKTYPFVKTKKGANRLSRFDLPPSAIPPKTRESEVIVS